jgi:acyl-coenzyme A thioesterase PaaI-like protein
MEIKAFQDYYPDHLSHCYGCGKLNEHGYQIKTFWDGEETLTTFTPKSYHTAVPGFVYGGLLASLIDCHATGSAAGAMYRKENREMDTEPSFRFLTGSLFVKFLKPTPINCNLRIRGRIKAIDGKKVTIDVDVIADGIITVKGEVVAIQVPDKYIDEIIRSAIQK